MTAVIDFRHSEGELAALETDRSRLSMQRIVGRGNFGHVQLAEYTPADSGRARLVAVKILSEPQSMQGSGVDALQAFEQQVSLFLMEARLMNAVRHEHVVELVAVVLRQYPCMMVMEYMEHGDLRAYLRLCHPSRTSRLRDVGEGEMLLMAGQVASALAYMESRRIVHRDVAARCVDDMVWLCCV